MQFLQNVNSHKNFLFKQILDKTNDMIVLKSPKSMFLGHFLTIFWSFLPDGDFFQKIWLCQTQIYMAP